MGKKKGGGGGGGEGGGFGGPRKNGTTMGTFNTNHEGEKSLMISVIT